MSSPRDRLQLYHDGELGGLARWRVERWLRRDPAARRELEILVSMRALVREVASEPSAPELWSGIAARLASVDAEVRAAADERARSWELPWLLRPVAAGAALAAIVAAAVFLLTPAKPAPTGVVRWLDPQGHAVMVLEHSNDATIIWLMEPVSEEAGERGGRAFS